MQLRTANSLASDTSSVTLRTNDDDAAQSATASATSPIAERPTLPVETPNPWLVPRDEPSKSGLKKHEVAIGKSSASAEKSKNKLRKKVQKREEEKLKAKEDAVVDISMTNVMTLDSSLAGPSKQEGQINDAKQSQQDEDDSDPNSEVEEQERLLDRKGKGKAKGVKAFEQRDLVARAFAGDNVVRDFAETKRREMQEDAPKEVDTTLAGWVSTGTKLSSLLTFTDHILTKGLMGWSGC